MSVASDWVQLHGYYLTKERAVQIRDSETRIAANRAESPDEWRPKFRVRSKLARTRTLLGYDSSGNGRYVEAGRRFYFVERER